MVTVVLRLGGHALGLGGEHQPQLLQCLVALSGDARYGGLLGGHGEPQHFDHLLGAWAYGLLVHQFAYTGTLPVLPSSRITFRYFFTWAGGAPAAPAVAVAA